MAGLVKDLQEENQQLMAENQRANGSLEQVGLQPPTYPYFEPDVGQLA